MGNASQINRSRNSVRVERRSDLNESDLGEVYCISSGPSKRAALKTAGEEVSDALLVAMIIKGLPQPFSTFSALTSQNTEEPTVTEFKVALSSYEETMKARGGTTADDDQVLYTAQSNVNTANRRLTCYNLVLL